jgi:tRNA(fMet)-specific endonuclease VapC
VAVLIDSSVFVASERQAIPFTDIAVISESEVAVLAAITASELLAGVYRAGTLARRLQRETFVEQILSTILIIPFDLSAAREYARLSAQMRASGQAVGAHDLQIAATALAGGFEIVTHNLPDFGRIPGVKMRATLP